MFERTRLVFDSGGVGCAAYLFRPAQTGAGLVPAVVIGHGASGTTANLFPIAERFPRPAWLPWSSTTAISERVAACRAS